MSSLYTLISPKPTHNMPSTLSVLSEGCPPLVTRRSDKVSKYAKYDNVLGPSKDLTMKKKKNRVESFERSNIHSLEHLKSVLNEKRNSGNLEFHIRATIPFSFFDLPFHPEPANVDALYNHIRREIYEACGIALVLNHTDRAKDNVTRSKRYICRQDSRGDSSKKGGVSNLKKYDCGSRFIFKYKDRYAFVELDLLHKSTHHVNTPAKLPPHMKKASGVATVKTEGATTPEQKKMEISRFLVNSIDESPLQSDSDDCAAVPMVRKRSANFTYTSENMQKKRRSSSISDGGLQLPKIQVKKEHVPVLLPSLEVSHVSAAEQVPRLEPLPQTTAYPSTYTAAKLNQPMFSRNGSLDDVYMTSPPTTAGSTSITQQWLDQQQRCNRMDDNVVLLPPLMQRSVSLDQTQNLPVGMYAQRNIMRSNSLDQSYYSHGASAVPLVQGQWNSVWAGPAYPHAYGIPAQARPMFVYASPYSSRHSSFSRVNAYDS